MEREIKEKVFRREREIEERVFQTATSHDHQLALIQNPIFERVKLFYANEKCKSVNG
jgi:hypothetical protein